MYTSAVPGVIDQLIAVLRADPGLNGIQVIDGPPAEDMSATEFVAVGWTLTDSTAAELQQRFNAAGARTRDEDFSIAGWVESWTGDAEIGPRRRRAFELLGLVEVALRASDANPEAPTLNGSALWAQLANASLQQAFTDQGARAGIAFTITGRSRL
ncbi:hypothetical protein [Streptomyces sp. SID3212]|uniref:hypothetical protein n=1 Tax=Streptomyces sp. SID3212 TaxID=2690259 RepID=UPI00136F2657|nr:hypothetical protein [Streptomyces sp. SID3212]MYV56507.1 hypothetical protein [Streptomyces sp. SID3212]